MNRENKFPEAGAWKRQLDITTRVQLFVGLIKTVKRDELSRDNCSVESMT